MGERKRARENERERAGRVTVAVDRWSVREREGVITWRVGGGGRRGELSVKMEEKDYE